MRKILRNRQFWSGVVMALAFIPLAFMPSIYLFDLVNAMTVSVGLGVLVAYGPGVIRSFRQREWTGAQYLVLGITATWMSTTGRHVWSWIWRLKDKPDTMSDHWALAFIAWVTLWGGILHLAAKGAIEDDIPRDNWLRAGIFVAIGVGFALIVIMVFDRPIL